MKKLSPFIKSEKTLKKVVADLGKLWPDQITNDDVRQCRKMLKKVHFPKKKTLPADKKSRHEKEEVWEVDKNNCYKYEKRKYPQLLVDSDLNHSHSDGPITLAEALLWKLGRWKVYRQFVQDFHFDFETCSFETRKSYESRIVFVAFAKHLQDPEENPIFDQHALRALWAISESLQKAKMKHEKRKEPPDKEMKTIDNEGKAPSEKQQQFEEMNPVERYLMDTSRNWSLAYIPKETRLECYALFCSEIEVARERSTDLKISNLDKLLMPLGKALMDFSKIPDVGEKKSHFLNFSKLCNWTKSRGDGSPKR